MSRSDGFSLPHVVTLLLCLATAYGCSTVSVGPKLHLPSTVRALEVGATTTATMVESLGEPQVKMAAADYYNEGKRVFFGGDPVESIWVYQRVTVAVFDHSDMQREVLWLEFDAGGTLRELHYGSPFEDDNPSFRYAHFDEFDLLMARDRIVPGTATRGSVLELLGPSSRVMHVPKRGVKERLRYETASRVGGVTYVKSMDIDVAADDSVLSVKGESSFPADRERALREEATVRMRNVATTEPPACLTQFFGYEAEVRFPEEHHCHPAATARVQEVHARRQNSTRERLPNDLLFLELRTSADGCYEYIVRRAGVRRRQGSLEKCEVPGPLCANEGETRDGVKL